MKSSLRICCLVSVFALSTTALQHRALAQLKPTSDDSILVVRAGDNSAVANRRFISSEDKLRVMDAILQTQYDLSPLYYHVEIIRGDQTIQLEADMKQFSHDPSPKPSDVFLKRGDVVIIRPKITYF